MSRKKMEGRTVHKAGKPSHGGANGYIHVAKPATASQILRDLGISQAHKGVRENVTFPLAACSSL